MRARLILQGKLSVNSSEVLEGIIKKKNWKLENYRMRFDYLVKEKKTCSTIERTQNANTGRQEFMKLNQIRTDLILEITRTIEILAESVGVGCNYYSQPLSEYLAYAERLGENTTSYHLWKDLDKNDVEFVRKVNFRSNQSR